MVFTKLFVVAALSAGVLGPLSASHAGTLTTLYNFQGGADGSSPEGSLTYHDGFFYGVTIYGGTSSAKACANIGCGTIFKIDAATGAETVLYAFDQRTGQSPSTGVFYYHDKLYGTAYAGGSAGYGTVFQFDLGTGKLKVLHSFSPGMDGLYPSAGLTYANGKFYGTTISGGSASGGTVFAIDAATEAETVLYNFTGAGDGRDPRAGLIPEGENLLGTTSFGGAANNGTVFSVNQNTGAETVLYSFGSAPDAADPVGPLVYEAGSLFGTSSTGGATKNSGPGTIFEVNATTGAENVLYRFRRSTGDRPLAGLTVHGGNFYGTTALGGPYGQGSMFRLNTSTDKATVLQSFTYQNGGQPRGGLIYHAGGFYGTTSVGGVAGLGTVFELTQ